MIPSKQPIALVTVRTQLVKPWCMAKSQLREVTISNHTVTFNEGETAATKLEQIDLANESIHDYYNDVMRMYDPTKSKQKPQRERKPQN